MKLKRANGHVIIFSGLLLAAHAAAFPAVPDSLRSWNSGPNKALIVQFIRDVTTEGGPHFVPPKTRVAVLSDDGTLCPEEPMPAALSYVTDRVKSQLQKHPKWRSKEPYKSALAHNLKLLSAAGQRGILELMGGTHAGMTTEEFDRTVNAWLARARNTKLNRPWLQCAYQPMVELMSYLRAYGFRVFIVSRGSAEFTRLLMEKLYGVSPDQVIGGTSKTKLEVRKGESVLVRRPEYDLLESRAGRPAAIYRATGCRPIAAFGSSDDDLEILNWVAGGAGKHLGLIVRHTDSGNEFAYDRKALFGRLDKALDTAKKKGWIIADMTKDWSRVFPKADR